MIALNASDRVALMLGRAILRSEQLADDLAAAQQRIAELETASAGSGAESAGAGTP